MLFAVINIVKNIFPVSQKFSLCYSKIPCVFPVWKKKEPNSLFSLFRGHPALPFTILTLDNQVVLSVWSCTHWTNDQACAGSTLRVVILPLAAKSWSCFTTRFTAHTPRIKRSKFFSLGFLIHFFCLTVVKFTYLMLKVEKQI